LEKSLLEQNTPVGDKHHDAMNPRSWLISLTSLFFILLQSLRLLIGVGSLAAAVAGARFLDSIHGPVVRIPMEIVAVAGSVINLYAIWRVRSLRARPSSQWRVEPVTPEKRRAESIQIALAVLTLLLVGVEWAFHIYLHGSI
jgi:hypothetical protein